MKQYTKYLYLIIPIIILIAGSFYFLNNKTGKNIPVAKGLGNIVQTNSVQAKKVTSVTSTKVNGYEINFTRSSYEDSMIDGSSEIDITKDGKQVWGKIMDQDFSGFYVDEPGDFIKNADELKTKAIKDITGNGIPELFVEGYSGGAHCCSHSYIVELSDPIKVLFDLDTGDNGIEFKDLNHDGIMELSTNEDVFAYWHTSFAASPMPEVVLSLQNGKYKADPKYMRKPAPTDAEIKKMADSVESWSGAQGPDVAWKYAINLIYSGNVASAKKYVDLAWQSGDAGDFGAKAEFWKELDDQIKTSPYYKDLSSFFNLQ